MILEFKLFLHSTGHCGTVPTIENGGVYPETCTSSDALPPGTECFFYCDQSYALEGSSIICSSTGEWDGITPLCKSEYASIFHHQVWKEILKLLQL